MGTARILLIRGTKSHHEVLVLALLCGSPNAQPNRSAGGMPNWSSSYKIDLAGYMHHILEVFRNTEGS